MGLMLTRGARAATSRGMYLSGGLCFSWKCRLQGSAAVSCRPRWWLSVAGHVVCASQGLMRASREGEL